MHIFARFELFVESANTTNFQKKLPNQRKLISKQIMFAEGCEKVFSVCMQTALESFSITGQMG